MYALQAMHLFILFCFSSSIQLKIAQTMPECLTNCYVVNWCTGKGSVSVQEALQGRLASMLDLMQRTCQISWTVKEHKSLCAACFSGKKACKIKNMWVMDVH